MSRTLAEGLVDTLARAGVQRIHGIVGDSLNPVADAIRRSDKMRWVHVRHEETAAFAAGAEAQLTGRLAVCAGSCGAARGPRDRPEGDQVRVRLQGALSQAARGSGFSGRGRAYSPLLPATAGSDGGEEL